jgi:hypothetical protein
MRSPTYSQQHLTLSHMICPIVSLGTYIGGLGTYMFGVNVSICWRVSKVSEFFCNGPIKKAHCTKRGQCQQKSLAAKQMNLSRD